MISRKKNIATKAATFVENHSFVASLLAVLCLAFAVNYYLVGPGSDGGSGLGGTGKAGGESGFGGTGKGPDTGPGFKLGANDQDSLNNRDSLTETLIPGFDEYSDADNTGKQLAVQLSELDRDNASANEGPKFDITMLKLTPLANPIAKMAPDYRPETTPDLDISLAALKIIAEGTESTELDNIVINEINQLANQTLPSSIDILNRLMLVEAEARLRESTGSNPSANDFDDQVIGNLENENVALADNTVRNRIALPARPERPDRLNVPARIAPVQRVNIPSPPPVRPMRTLSTILNR